MFLVFDDDEFRRNLIKALDERHFSVTFSADGDAAVETLKKPHEFRVVIVAVDLEKKKGLDALAYLEQHRSKARCGVMIVGEPNPAVRTFAPWVDETLLKPVDAEYIATRARVYCDC